MSTIKGQFLTIEQYNQYFSDVSTMLLYFYDTPEFEDAVIVLGSYLKKPVVELQKQYPHKRIIIYQMEQLVGNETWWPIEQTIRNMRGADEIWDYDALNIKFLELYYQIKGVQLRPLRFTPTLNRSLPRDTDIDVLFYGTMNERRFRWIEHIQNHFYDKIRLVTINGIGAADLDFYIARSKIILNVHAFEPYNRQEQVRMFYPAINNKIVLSEKTQLNHMGKAIYECSWDSINGMIEEFIHPKIAKDYGVIGSREFKRLTFDKTDYQNHIEALQKEAAK